MLAAIICSAALKTVACHPFESQNGQSAKVAGFEENLPMCRAFVAPAAGPSGQHAGRGAQARVGRMGDRVV